MKDGWEYKTLGEILKIKHGKDYKGVSAIESKYPVYGSGSDVVGYVDEFLCEADTIILGRKGTIDKPRYMDHRYWNIDTAFSLSAHIGYSTKFIYYFCLTVDWLSLNSGAAKPSLTQALIYGQTIHIPKSFSEQQSIVEYLDESFARIDAIKANAEKALNEANAIFQASLKILLEPKEGWEEKTVEQLATDMYRGSGVKKDQVTKDGISCVRYGEIYTKYNYHFDKCYSHTLTEYVSTPKYFEHGDIIFAITGESVEDIGKCASYLGVEKCIAGSDTVVLKHNQEPRYLAYALSTPSAVIQKGRGKTKLKVVHTNIPSLKEIVLPIAPMAEQASIADTLDIIHAKVIQLQSNYNKISKECDALKQALLKQVFE